MPEVEGASASLPPTRQRAFLQVGSREYDATAADFGAPTAALAGPLVLADPPMADRPLANAAAAAGSILLIRRGGGVAFADKALRAVEAGAAAIVFVNSADGVHFAPGVSDPAAVGRRPGSRSAAHPISFHSATAKA